MIDNVDIQQILGNFEDWLIRDDQVEDLKEQIKLINKNKNIEMKEYAKDLEITKGVLGDAYRHFKKMKRGNADPEELYEIISRIDMALEEEQAEEEKKDKAREERLKNATQQ